MHIIDCDLSHGAAILAIFNEVIVSSTALYDYKPRTPAMMIDWFDAKQRGHWPIVGVAEQPGGELLGFGSFGPFRNYPAYKYTIEHSLYVAAPHRGKGIGRQILEELITRATQRELHVMVGAIDSGNDPSIRLHEKMGFTRVAMMPQVGFKFGRWLDLCLYQRVLDTPGQPSEA